MEKFADQYTLKICAYKDFLICTHNKTPKSKTVGIGTSLTNFNKNDVLISKDALALINKNINKIPTNKIDAKTGLIISSRSNIFWASYDNIIVNIKDTEIFAIPTHTEIDNDVDEKLKTQLDKL